jgi:hypothetical protein
MAKSYPPILPNREKGQNMVKMDRASGLQRLEEEAGRLAKIRKAAVPPAECSFQIGAAPARGPQVVFRDVQVVLTASGPRLRQGTVQGQHAARVASAFQRMEDQRRRRAPDAAPLFTAAQVDAGLAYAALTERWLSAGVKCSSVEAIGQGGGGGSFIDAVIADGERLTRMRAAIGVGIALRASGPAAHADRGRRLIRVRDLVDAVCIDGRTLSELLVRFGWSGVTKNRMRLMPHICSALDRMQGL